MKNHLKESIIERLKTCFDPEIPLDLWSLGLIYDVEIEEKNKLYYYLSELIIKKVLFTKVEKVFHINDIKEAINAASDFNRDGKILVTTSKA